MKCFQHLLLNNISLNSLTKSNFVHQIGLECIAASRLSPVRRKMSRRKCHHLRTSASFRSSSVGRVQAHYTRHNSTNQQWWFNLRARIAAVKEIIVICSSVLPAIRRSIRSIVVAAMVAAPQPTKMIERSQQTIQNTIKPCVVVAVAAARATETTAMGHFFSFCLIPRPRSPPRGNYGCPVAPGPELSVLFSNVHRSTTVDCGVPWHSGSAVWRSL